MTEGDLFGRQLITQELGVKTTLEAEHGCNPVPAIPSASLQLWLVTLDHSIHLNPFTKQPYPAEKGTDS